MNLLRHYLGDLFTFEDQAFVFPEDLTVLVGKNGSGKTCLGVEAIAWALWGETVRGTSPLGQVTTELQVGTDRWLVERRNVSARDKTLTISRWREEVENPTWDDQSGQTNTETQNRINEVFGPWRRFAATRVMSLQRLQQFGNATDKERKLLLETILGLEQFERAAKHARAQADVARTELETTQQELKILGARAGEVQAQLERGRARAKEVSTSGNPWEELAAVRLQIETLRAQISDNDGRLREASSDLDVAGRAEDKARFQIDHLTKEIAALKLHLDTPNVARCTACNQSLPAEAALKHRRETESRYQAALAALGNAQGMLRAAAGEQNDCRFLVTTISEELTSLRLQLNELGPPERRLSEACTVLDFVQKEATALGNILAELREEESARLQQEQLQAAAWEAAKGAVAILGPGGARADLLNDTLWRLENAANDTLMELGSAIRVGISGKTARKDGREADEVSIIVKAAGGGEYRGTSGGERVLIDLSLLLGLAKISGDTGLIVFDEIFDPLDDEWIEAAALLIQRTARDRQVVVITHNPRFLDLFPQGRVFRVETGPRSSTVTAA